MRKLSRSGGLVIGSVLAISLLFNSVVYACSGLMGMSLQAASMNTMNSMGGTNENTIERGPCADHKQDICKSVRDRMLSIQPSPYKAIDSQQTIISLVPLNLTIGILKQLSLSPTSTTWKTAFHAVFKLPLPFSFSVLRI